MLTSGLLYLYLNETTASASSCELLLHSRSVRNVVQSSPSCASLKMFVHSLHAACHIIKHRLNTHTHLYNSPFSGTTRVSRYQKGKTNPDFTEARDSEWQWHQLGHMQVCISLQTENHASTHHTVFLQAGCPSCRPTNSVKALKAYVYAKHMAIQ